MECRHFVVPLLLFLTVFVSTAFQNPLSPDTKKLYHDITSGKGLYSEFDKVTVLNATNFKDNVFNETNSRAWIVEFYNSWCGHCLRFAPIWKAFASDIYEWRDIIAVGAVDCSNTNNTPLCREYEIMYYPMIKYFSISSPRDSLGTAVKQDNVDKLRHSVISAVEVDLSKSGIRRPNLLPYNEVTLTKLWENTPEEVVYTVMVVEEENSFVGAELAFDMLKVKSIQVRTILNSNTHLMDHLKVSLLPAVFVIDRVNHIAPLNFSEQQGESRIIMYNSAKHFLRSKGLPVEDLKLQQFDSNDHKEADVKEVVYLMQIEEQIKEKLHLNQLSDVVFQLDLEKALKYSLTQEIPSKKHITGESLDALKYFIKILSKHFPFRERGIGFLKRLYDDISDRTEIEGSEFEAIARENEKNFEPVYLSPQGWLGCRGSQPHFRGYPCGLWLLFHTLTIHAESNRNKYPDDSPKAVLNAMLGYVKHFFGCAECSKHFQEMALTIEEKVTSLDESILWLWRSHNKVNKRLHGDKSEDPKHQKIQFPSGQMCPDCTTSSGDYVENRVLPFLKSMYHNISYLLLDELPPLSQKHDSVSYNNLLQHKVVGEDLGYNISKDNNKLVQFNFNIFDVSLCVILYICSVGIIILVSIKFLRRTYRKKVYVYDLFHKV